MSRSGAAPAVPPFRLASSTALIGALALAVVLPELVTGLSLSDSFVFNIGWSEQFRDLVRSGHLYPRWLPRSWEGAGSPTFYFYPPFFFWLLSAIDAVTLRLLPLSMAISVTSAAVLAGSGLAMRAWLSRHASPRTATVGAVGYMLAPYHLFDIYYRGALAEACAYLFLPLVLIGLARTAERGLAGVPLLAAAFAGMILSHLPLALLSAVTVIPGYVLLRTSLLERGRLAFIAHCSAGGLLALAVAALYLVPALSLLSEVSAEGLSGPFFRPETWFFWRVGAWPTALLKWLVVPISMAALLLAAAVAMAERGGRRSPEALFWALLVAALVLLMAGAMPFFWEIRVIAQVQFPWRLLVIVEFAVITMLVVSPPRADNPVVRAALLPAALAISVALLVVGFQSLATARGFDEQWASVKQGFRDAPEYLPPGMPLPLDEQLRPLPVAIRPPDVPLASAADPNSRLAAQAHPDGGVTVLITAIRSTRVTARRFAFPHWKVVDESGRQLEVGASGPLVAWDAQPGRHRYRLSPGSAPLEREGLFVSLGAFALLVALAWLTRRRRAEA